MKNIYKLLLLAVTIVAFNTPAVAQVGTASYYGKKFHGKRTASGEIFNQWAMTAASNQLPFGSKVKVTNLKTNKSTVVKINDTGGFAKYGRIIDLSKGAAQAIGCSLCQVKLEVLSRGDGKYRRQ